MPLNYLTHFFISSDTRYCGYEDAAPVVYGSVAMAVCLDPICRWVFEITPELNLADVVQTCEDHWHYGHQLLGRDL